MNLVGIQAEYIFRVGVDPTLNFELDADSNDCKYSVTVTENPESAHIILLNNGLFSNPDPEFVRLW